MTFGAGKGMLSISAPPFDRFVDSVDALPRLIFVDAVRQVFFRVTTYAQPGKFVGVLRDSGRATEGIPVDIMSCVRLGWTGVVIMPSSISP
jgi:hypothetical protein